jgi:hypothetical protein
MIKRATIPLNDGTAIVYGSSRTCRLSCVLTKSSVAAPNQIMIRQFDWLNSLSRICTQADNRNDLLGGRSCRASPVGRCQDLASAICDPTLEP